MSGEEYSVSTAPKLAVCTPWSSPFMYTQYVEHQLNLRHPDDWEVRHFLGKGWCPARRHADMCEKALAWGADLVCITGADQCHPEDMLVRLVARVLEGYCPIAALVPARGFVGWQEMAPFQKMAWRFTPNARTVLDADGGHLAPEEPTVEVIDPAAGAVQPVNFIGSGVLLFHRDHLLALKPPWFTETYHPDTMQRLASMDTTFVWRLQHEAGARVHVDTTIDVKHLHIFPIDDSYSARFADWAQAGVGDPAICVFQSPVEEPVNGR